MFQALKLFSDKNYGEACTCEDTCVPEYSSFCNSQTDTCDCLENFSPQEFDGVLQCVSDFIGMY